MGTGEAAAGVAEPDRSTPSPARVEGVIAHGIRVLPLARHADDRGSLVEVFRQSWKDGAPVVQWNLVESEENVFRGVHVHLGYEECYVVLRGRMVVGYRDLRPGSPTEGAAARVEVDGGRPCAVIVPPGIPHGLWYPTSATLLVGVTAYWDLRNEVGCHWLDPDLGLAWPRTDCRLSERDRSFPPLAAVRHRIPAWVDDRGPRG